MGKETYILTDVTTDRDLQNGILIHYLTYAREDGRVATEKKIKTGLITHIPTQVTEKELKLLAL